MKARTLSAVLKKVVKTFPAIVLTGPRQSGKTTLLRNLFGKTYSYINLENPDVRMRATEDMLGFLNQIRLPVILDEIQYLPQLLSYIKAEIDENRQSGQWLLTGSQNFVLMQGVTESLAGRAAILNLLPFSLAENVGNGEKSISIERLLNLQSPKHHEAPRVDTRGIFSALRRSEIPPKQKSSHFSAKADKRFDLGKTILRGNYPEIASNLKIDRDIWCGSYITTYLERDIRNLEQVGNLRDYEIFLRACATRTGQILDLTSIAKEIGVSFSTAKRWLSLLETGDQILLLHPYYRNIGKRLIKRPKIYFVDTGLASYLLGIKTVENLLSGPFFGPLFETMVVTDFWKRFLHHGQKPTMYYLRTRDGLEIDLVIELENKLSLIEIKSTSTIKPDHASSLLLAQRGLKDKIAKALIISNTKDSFMLKQNIVNFSCQEILTQ